ncbi:MAG: tryptophan-rich sensory protein [Phycisphaerales bacterium]|nr:MAG: tryptophan-rich sensory protein [Phycisphaerales bacterium]
MQPTSVTRLVIACTISFAPTLTALLFTTRQALSTWYANLNKPFFTPPAWLFGPVWTTLYLIMGISAFLVWQKGLESRPVRIALLFFLIQLALNALWTPLFFGLQIPLLAFVEIIFLLAAILLTIIFFAKVSAPAALLLCPYVLWVAFAAVLNASIWILNR